MAKFYGYTNVGGTNVEGVTVVARLEGKDGNTYYYNTISGPEGYYELEVPSDETYDLFFSKIEGPSAGATSSIEVSIGSTSYESGCGFSLSRGSVSSNILVNDKLPGPLSYWSVTLINKELNYEVTEYSSELTPVSFSGLISGETYTAYCYGSTGVRNGSVKSSINSGRDVTVGISTAEPTAQTLPNGSVTYLTNNVLLNYLEWVSLPSSSRTTLSSIIGPDASYSDYSALSSYDIEEKIYNRL